MDEATWKKLFYFSVAVLVSLFLLWFGSHGLFASAYDLSEGQLILLGIILVLAGIFWLGPAELREFWWVSLILVLMGFYAFARAAGIIDAPWLARLVGILSWLAAAILLYITWPGRQTKISTKDNDETTSG